MEIKNKRVFLRADFNVPIKDSVIKDDYRIISTLKTLDYLKNEGCKTIIVSHIETKDVDKPSLKPVYEYLKTKHPEYDIHFMENIEDVENINHGFESIQDGSFLLLENIRNLKGEKDNDMELAKKIKEITDVYVNDAFAVSHRNHMSVSALPSLYNIDHKMLGVQMKQEIDNLSKVLTPEKPFAVILSGAKFSTKLPLIEKYIKTADRLLIGGALFNNILKSLGYNVGKSLIDTDVVYIDKLVKDGNFTHKVFIPQTVKVKNINTNEFRISNIKDVHDDETIQDINIESVEGFISVIKKDNIKTIVWNGPIGNYEDERFKDGTISLAKGLIQYIVENESTHLFIGGGDTVAAINSLNIDNDRVFVSTGGGAMLEFLEKDGALPGVVNVTR
jgi:phosphoglycerate kinase